MKLFRVECIIAGVLFIVATATTMAGQTILGPMLVTNDVLNYVAEHRALFLAGVMFELINALASVGIAIALYPILWACVQAGAVAYISFRILEASLGLFAVSSLLLLLSVADSSAFVELHDQAFRLHLLVFSVGTLIFYPLLYKFRLVPLIISVWGLIGGLMLLSSILLIFFCYIEFESTSDMVLSLPIWINEMVLALWLIFRGVAFDKDP